MKKRWLSLLLTLCMLVIFAPAAMANDETQEIYVSQSGSDVTGTGGQNAPYATLAQAVTEAQDGATIYVMDDLTVNSLARITDKHVTITSVDPENPVTLTRGSVQGSDNNQNWYNSAMIEVTTNLSEDSENASSVTLKDIILTDAGEHNGTYFAQTNSKTISEDNTQFVQDSMVTAHGKSNRAVSIILDSGAVLEDYGGMSAVYGTMNAHITMKSGSVITAPNVADRVKSDDEPEDETGPAGAVWLQGAEFNMEAGAEIKDMVGRAIYADSGTVKIGGKIENISSDNDMWQGTGGFIVHLRQSAEGTVTSTAVIDNGSKSTSGNALSVFKDCSLLLENGSVVKSFKDCNVFYVQQDNAVLYMDGEVTDCSGSSHIVQANSDAFIITIGENAEIHDNTVGYGAIYAFSNNNASGKCGTINVYGKINNNLSTDRGGAIAMANNGSNLSVNMYEGAEICNNISTQTGGGILVSCGTFTMYGGTISNNISGANVSGEADQAGGGVFVRRGGIFKMYGGSITNNYAAGIGGGIAFEAGDYNNCVPNVQLVSGTISGNKMNADISSAGEGYSAQNGESNDIAITSDGSSHITRYMTIADDMTIGNESIYFAKYGFTMERPAAGVKIGNAATACETAVTTKLSGQNLKKVAGSFWYQFSDAIGSLTMTVPTTYDQSKELYAAIIETQEDGTPVANAGVSLRTVEVVDDSFTLSLPGSTNGYAVVLVQESAPAGVISVVPADLTIYMGGKGGYDAVYDGSTSTSSNSLPHPIFKVTVPDGVNVADLADLTFENKESGNTWKLVKVSDTENYYRFVPQTGTEVRVQYSNGSEIIVNDQFNPSEIHELFEEYTISIYSGGTSGTQVTASAGSDVYLVATGTGTLTVRAVADENPTSEVVEKVTGKLTSGTATAVKPVGTVYTLNDTGVTLPSDAKPSLLFDDIIEDAGSTARTDAIKAKVDEEVGAVGSNTTRHYEIKYLDLVDANNGNAWITSSEGMYIYWAYPEGTNQSTNFKLIHFKDLHRDGTNSGFNLDDITEAQIEKIEVTNTTVGITFHVEKAGFSPFALVWDVTASTPVNPNPPADPDDTGVSDLLDTENHGQYLYGYPDNTFGPDLNMTRAEVAQMFYNLLLDKNVPITVTFEDVPENAWYENAVNTLASLGIISGVGDNKFEPDRSITRAEFTAMAMKFAMGETGGENIFSDIKSTDWYYNAVVDSIKYGWINGYGDGTFRPNNPITRGEVTAIVNHMLGREADKQFVQNHSDELNAFSDITSKHWAYYHVAEATNTHRYVGENGSETWTSLE